MDEAMKEQEEYKGCPLLEISEQLRACSGLPVRPNGYGTNCTRYACAWYDQTAERCAVLSIARNK